MRNPQIKKDASIEALANWLEDPDQRQRRHARRAVEEALAYVLELRIAAALHDASQRFLTEARRTTKGLAALTPLSTELASLARKEFQGDGDVASDFGDENDVPNIPGLVNASPVIFDDADIALIEAVDAASRTLAETLGAAVERLGRRRIQPAPVTDRAQGDVLREAIEILRRGGLEYPEIGALIIDDWVGDSRARGERYRKLGKGGK